MTVQEDHQAVPQVSEAALAALVRLEEARGAEVASAESRRLLEEQLIEAIPLPGGALALEDDDCPWQLRALAEPPAVIAWTGDLSLLDRQSRVAIVGSRDATPERRSAAKSLATSLAERGTLIVSGLAAGIDRAAHEGALAARSASGEVGRTVGVLGTPLKKIYPDENLALGEVIAREGLLLSEVPQLAALSDDEETRAFALRRRNRIVAALALGTVVMAARPGSSTLIEARASLEIGHPVLIWHEAAQDDWAKAWREADPRDKSGERLIRVVSCAADVDEALSPWRRVWWL